jgi:phage gp29-like protein
MAENTRPDMNEVATTSDGRDITRGYVDPLSIQPASDEVLRIRGGGDYRIYKEVLRDDQVSACFNQRRLAVIGKECKVDPGGKTRKDKAAADFLQEQIRTVGFDRVTDLMLYGVYYGFAVAEPLWDRDSRYVVMPEIKVRDRRRFGFDGAGRLRMKTMQKPDGELLPERKFWSFRTGADHDDEPYGVGLGHWLYWPAFFKRQGLKYWLLFLEKFGQPTAKGTYGEDATSEQKQKLLQALAAVSTDSGIAVPEGMVIELLEAARSGTADYAAVYDRMDAAIAKVILGQTASTQGTPGRLGNDELQADVRLDLVKADADLVCESFNRSIGTWLTEWNFPGAAVPTVYRDVEPTEDANKRAERDKTIFDMGFRPTLKHITDTYGGEWEAVPGKEMQKPAPRSFTEFSAMEGEERNPAERLADRLSGEAEPSVNRWIEQIEVMLEQANGLEEFRSMLIAAFPDLPQEELGTLLGEANMAAHAAGRYDVEQGHE